MYLYLALLVTLIFRAEAGCRSGWIQHDESCYLLSHDTETWVDAMNVCKAFGGYLVEIDDPRENNFSKTLVDPLNYEAWIGATDLMVEGEWMWFKSEQPLAYSNWAANEPSNGGHDENCAEIIGRGVWNDDQCHKFQHYICEAPLKTDVSVVG